MDNYTILDRFNDNPLTEYCKAVPIPFTEEEKKEMFFEGIKNLGSTYELLRCTPHITMSLHETNGRFIGGNILMPLVASTKLGAQLVHGATTVAATVAFIQAVTGQDMDSAKTIAARIGIRNTIRPGFQGGSVMAEGTDGKEYLVSTKFSKTTLIVIITPRFSSEHLT